MNVARQPACTQIPSPSAPQVFPKMHGTLPGNCCCSVAPPRVSATQYVRREDLDSHVTVYGAPGRWPMPRVTEIPPLCGAIAASDCDDRNKATVPNIVISASAAMQPKLDFMLCTCRHDAEQKTISE